MQHQRTESLKQAPYMSTLPLPALRWHASVPAEQRKELGISDSLVRLSVGIEDLADLTADLNQALEKASAVAK
jgi:cystathionine gamma-lyase